MKIALIAHDKKKAEIIELAKKYKDVLRLFIRLTIAIDYILNIMQFPIKIQFVI